MTKNASKPDNYSEDADQSLEFSAQRRAVVTGMLGGLAAVGTGLLGSAAAQAQSQPATEKPLRGKVAVVTGARNNFGRAFAVALAKGGANVLIHYHREESLTEAKETERLVQTEGVKTALAVGDLGQAQIVKAMFDTAVREFGKVDIVISNAGAIIKKPVAQITDADFEKLMNVNTRANFLVAREAARRLADNGRLIFTGTSLLAGAAPGYGAYSGTKAIVEELTRMMCKELGTRGITVNSINPGAVNTPFFASAETPESTRFAASLSVAGRLGEIPDLVPLISFIASPSAQWINGQSLWINGGYLTR